MAEITTEGIPSRGTSFRHIASGTVVVTASANRIQDLSKDGGANYVIDARCSRMTIQNLDAAETIYLAPTSSVVVADANNQGWILGPFDTKEFYWPKADLVLLYFIGSEATVRMRVWEEYQRC
jgi:hypothetical protein